MKILFTICGRAGSKGVKSKNVRDFLDKPLVYYTLSAIELYTKQNLDVDYDVCLNTDSEKLIEIVHQYASLNVEILLRDESLAGDFVGKIDVIRDCYYRMKNKKSTDYDMVVDLDITSPLRKVQDIKNIIEKFDSCDAQIVYSVCPSRRNPYFNMVKKVENGVVKVIPSEFVSRQQAPEIFDQNASIYAYDVEFLSTELPFSKASQDIIIMKDTAVLDIDCEEDLELMQVIAKYLFENDEGFREVYEMAQNLII